MFIYLPSYLLMDRQMYKWMDGQVVRQKGLLAYLIYYYFLIINYLFVCLFTCKIPFRSPGLVNFGLLDELLNLPKYRGIRTPTVEIIGDLAHV